MNTEKGPRVRGSRGEGPRVRGSKRTPISTAQPSIFSLGPLDPRTLGPSPRVPPHLADLRYMIVAPAFQPWDLGRYCQRLMRADGLACATFAYGDRPGDAEDARLREVVRQFRPHIVLGLKLQGIRPPTLAAIRRQAFVALWYVDCFGEFVPRWLAVLLRHVDVFFTTAEGLLPIYRRHTGAPVHWLYEGAHLPSFPLRREPPERLAAYRSEVAFVGNVRHAPTPVPAVRERLLRRVHRRFDLRIWGLQGVPRDARTKRLKVTEGPAHNPEPVPICHAPP